MIEERGSAKGSAYPNFQYVEKNRKKVEILKMNNKIKNVNSDVCSKKDNYDNDNNNNNNNGMKIENKVNDRNGNNNKAVLLAGAMAGLAYVLSSHPLEIASILMQIDVPLRRQQELVNRMVLKNGKKRLLEYR